MQATIKKPINWGPVIFLTTYQTLLLLLLPFYLYFDTPTLAVVVTTVFLIYATGMSITGGYHRYYAHRSYRTNKIVEFFLLFLGSMTAQGSALRWAFDHRLHHANVDTEDDPYSIKKGFWYAHCLWIIEKPRTIDPKVVSDLLKNPLVAFQHRYYKLCMLASNAISTLFFGYIFNDYLAAFVMTLWVRLFVLHHFTWFINSLAHTWGDKPFCKELSAVDNYCLSMLTFGEGYHNYHHTFANDYRNGIRWFHFDPTKWMIWTLSKLGLASGLKKTDPTVIEKRIVLESKNHLLNHINEICHAKKNELEILIQETSERIVAKIGEFNALKAKYLASKNSENGHTIIKELKKELKEIKRSLRSDWKQWMSIVDSVTRASKPA